MGVEVVGETVESVLREPVDWRFKGFPEVKGATVGNVHKYEWKVLDGDFIPPIMVLKESAFENNLALMSAFCTEHHVFLAPHGKTSMAPQIIARQIEVGAWAITVATISQARVMRAMGVDRILLANEITSPAAIRWAVEELERDNDFYFLSLVDSEDSVELLSEALEEADMTAPLPVLIEFGTTGMRAGARSLEAALRTAEAVEHSDTLRLVGVEAFEGVIQGTSIENRLKKVDDFLAQLSALAFECDARNLFRSTDSIVLSAGGSIFFDRVARLVEVGPLSRPLEVVLRSGCYITHDHGSYDRSSPFGSNGQRQSRFRPALEIWAEVLSCPEPNLAIVNMGKRDAPYDSGLPVPIYVKRIGGQVSKLSGATVTALNDQHAYVAHDEDVLNVGDLLGFGISHPCTAFDKWRLIPVVDDAYTVVGAIKTYF
jgi:D-serine deaminase-like pyridoxal phosphate-dependent protein